MACPLFGTKKACRAARQVVGGNNLPVAGNNKGNSYFKLIWKELILNESLLSRQAFA